MASARHSLQIGDWYVFADTCTLSAANGAKPTKITPRSMDVLVYLAENAGSVISSTELLDKFWRGTISSDHAVHKAIAELRAAFGDKAHNSQYIKTVPKRGYSLVANLVPLEKPGFKTREKSAWWQSEPLVRSVKYATGLGAAAVLLAILFFSQIDLVLNEDSGIRIAVLPFSQDSEVDGSKQFFVEGLSESLITGLSKLNQLSISNPTTERGLNSRQQSAQEYGEQLVVEHLLEGSVQYSGDRVRITVQLIRVEDGVHQYSEQFDMTEHGIFEIQDQIVANVVTSLSIHLDETQRSQMRDWGTSDEGISSNFTDIVAGVLTGELQPGSDALARQYALGRDFNFNNGSLSFMLGDIDKGLEYWSALAPVHKRRLINNVHVSEMYLADGVVEDKRYQDLLEELDFGLAWQRTLMEGIMAMQPITGVELSQKARQA